MYVRELPRHVPQQPPKREKKISSDYQVTICCVCCIDVNISKSSCKLVPSVLGFASAKFDIFFQREMALKVAILEYLVISWDFLKYQLISTSQDIKKAPESNLMLNYQSFDIVMFL